MDNLVDEGNGAEGPRISVTADKGSQSAAAGAGGRLTAAAMATMLLLCFIWGGNLVAIKISNRGFDPLFAATLRSVGAAVLLGGWALITRHSLRISRTAFTYAVVIGLFFGLEFLFLFWGTKFTLASRGTILVYTSPFWVALGGHFILRERLSVPKVTGLLLAFGGVAAVFATKPGTLPSTYLLGDAMEIVAAVSWAISTLYSKKSMNKALLSPLQLLFYQVLVSIPLLLGASLIFEGVPAVTWRVDAILSLAHQTVIIVSITYLVWFWLLGKFQAGHITAFSFFTPLFGVAMGGLFLGEPITWLLALGVSLVAVGIYLVQRR